MNARRTVLLGEGLDGQSGVDVRIGQPPGRPGIEDDGEDPVRHRAGRRTIVVRDGECPDGLPLGSGGRG
jgi:hypothetical protein